MGKSKKRQRGKKRTGQADAAALRRLAAVFGIGVFAVLMARLYQLQIKEHEFYEGALR